MNVHEERSWRILVELGAREFKLGGKHALDLSPIRLKSQDKLCLYTQAVLGVVGRSNANRWHVDRRGCPIYVVTDYYTVDRPNDLERHEPEHLAQVARTKARLAKEDD